MSRVYQIHGTLDVGGIPVAFTHTVEQDEIERVYGSVTPHDCRSMQRGICNRLGRCECYHQRRDQAERFVRDLYRHENIRIDVQIVRFDEHDVTDVVQKGVKL